MSGCGSDLNASADAAVGAAGKMVLPMIPISVIALRSVGAAMTEEAQAVLDPIMILRKAVPSFINIFIFSNSLIGSEYQPIGCWSLQLKNDPVHSSIGNSSNRSREKRFSVSSRLTGVLSRHCHYSSYAEGLRLRTKCSSSLDLSFFLHSIRFRNARWPPAVAHHSRHPAGPAAVSSHLVPGVLSAPALAPRRVRPGLDDEQLLSSGPETGLAPAESCFAAPVLELHQPVAVVVLLQQFHLHLLLPDPRRPPSLLPRRHYYYPEVDQLQSFPRRLPAVPRHPVPAGVSARTWFRLFRPRRACPAAPRLVLRRAESCRRRPSECQPQRQRLSSASGVRSSGSGAVLAVAGAEVAAAVDVGKLLIRSFASSWYDCCADSCADEDQEDLHCLAAVPLLLPARRRARIRRGPRGVVLFHLAGGAEAADAAVELPADEHDPPPVAD